MAHALITLRQQVAAGKTAMDDLVKEFKAGKDKAAMDAFRGLQAEFDHEERSLLSSRGEEADRLRP